MTANQLRYQELQELKRSNQEKEKETNRSNLAKEAETNRANIAKETETNRSNVMNEVLKERQQDFDANEIFASVGYLSPAEDWIKSKKSSPETIKNVLKPNANSSSNAINKMKAVSAIVRNLLKGTPDTSVGAGGGGMKAR